MITTERAIRKYTKLAVPSRDQLLYGVCPHPLACGLGLTIGGGQVFPEVNFTLPPMNMSDETWPDVVAHYEQMAEQILRRAASLAVPGIVLEFELLPPYDGAAGVGRRAHGAAEAASQGLSRKTSSRRGPARHPYRYTRSAEAASHADRLSRGNASSVLWSFVRRPAPTSSPSSRSAARKCTTRR